MKVTLQSKFALIGLVLSSSTKEDEMDYKTTVNLTPAYVLSPEVVLELKENKLLDENNKPTSAGIWFAYFGTSDSRVSFEKYISGLNPKAIHTLVCFAIGKLAEIHEGSKHKDLKLQIEGVLNSIEEFINGTTWAKVSADLDRESKKENPDYLSAIPDNFKQFSDILVDYRRMQNYNKNKYQ